MSGALSYVALEGKQDRGFKLRVWCPHQLTLASVLPDLHPGVTVPRGARLGWGGTQYTPVLPCRNGISNCTLRTEVRSGSPPERKGPELHLEEVDTALTGPRGKLGRVQRESLPGRGLVAPAPYSWLGEE